MILMNDIGAILLLAIILISAVNIINMATNDSDDLVSFICTLAIFATAWAIMFVGVNIIDEPVTQEDLNEQTGVYELESYTGDITIYKDFETGKEYAIMEKRDE